MSASTRVATGLGMVAYRALAQSLQKRLSLGFEESLASVAAVIRGVSHELSPQEGVVVKENIAPELKQLITASRPQGTHDARRSIELVASELEISPADARNRIIAVLEELRGAVGPWDELRFAELLDNALRQIMSIMVEPAVA